MPWKYGGAAADFVFLDLIQLHVSKLRGDCMSTAVRVAQIVGWMTLSSSTEAPRGG